MTYVWRDITVCHTPHGTYEISRKGWKFPMRFKHMASAVAQFKSLIKVRA